MPAVGITPILITPVVRTSILTADGQTFPIMEVCGFPIRVTLTGRPIGMAAGCMNLIMAGHGFLMNPGVGLRTIMVGGLFTTVTGAGGLGRCTRDIVRYGRRHTCHSSDSAAEVSALALAADLAAWG